MNTDKLLDRLLVVSILSGVNTRNYANIVSRGLKLKGVSKSSVSGRVIKATKPLVDEFRKREIGTIEPALASL